jgi:hypothetical protein
MLYFAALLMLRTSLLKGLPHKSKNRQIHNNGGLCVFKAAEDEHIWILIVKLCRNGDRSKRVSTEKRAGGGGRQNDRALSEGLIQSGFKL